MLISDINCIETVSYTHLAIYIPDNYAKYTMLFDGQEYAYNYASAISCIEYVAETYWRPSSSEFKNGINGPSIKINGQDLYIKTFSYHVGEDNICLLYTSCDTVINLLP